MMGVNDSLEAIVSRVTELVADLAGVDPAEIDEDTPVFDSEDGLGGLALDSLDGLKLGLTLADWYGLGDDDGLDYQQFQTVRQIAQFIHRLPQEGQS